MYRNVKTLLMLHALRRIAQAMSLRDSISSLEGRAVRLEGSRLTRRFCLWANAKCELPENRRLASRWVLRPNRAVRSAIQPIAL